MSNDEIYKLLNDIAQVDILVNEPMSKHTSFKIGGPADFFAIPECKESLIQVIKTCTENEIPFYIIGNGSNLLVSDKGIRGVVIQIFKRMNSIHIEGDCVTVEAGQLLSKLSREIYDASLEGFEFASGIPGTIGGALYMNAGAYGGEMKDVIESVEAVDMQGQFISLTKEELDFGYRSSVLQKNNLIAVSATLRLKKGKQESIKHNLEELTLQRVTKQPLEMPSAGSTFKRPEGYYAGKLIMDSGLRGYSIGGAQISEKHCGFVVNKGNATAEDVLNLINHVKNVVKDKFNVELETEIKIIGE